MSERGIQNTTAGGHAMVAPSAWASHILVASKSEALQIKDKVGKLKDFQKLARKKSTCPSSQKGGDLGWFRKGRMVKEFEDTVWTAPLNTVSAPVKTQFGYHLIWVHERDEDA
jgi:peptidyl-prolyl cis-trans isomerase C